MSVRNTSMSSRVPSENAHGSSTAPALSAIAGSLIRFKRFMGALLGPALGPIDLTAWLRPHCDAGSRPHPDGGGTTCPRCGGAGGCAGLSWVIAGGESGPNARPAHPDWFRSLRDQCAAAGVPFLFKQWGEWLPWSQFTGAAIDDPPEQTRFATREFFDGQWDDVGRPGYWEVMDGEVDDEQCVGRVGKKAAGRLLDGVTHDAFPEHQAEPSGNSGQLSGAPAAA